MPKFNKHDNSWVWSNELHWVPQKCILLTRLQLSILSINTQIETIVYSEAFNSTKYCILLGTDLTESRSVMLSLESPLRGRRDVSPFRPKALFYHRRYEIALCSHDNNHLSRCESPCGGIQRQRNRNGSQWRHHINNLKILNTIPLFSPNIYEIL